MDGACKEWWYKDKMMGVSKKRYFCLFQPYILNINYRCFGGGGFRRFLEKCGWGWPGEIFWRERECLRTSILCSRKKLPGNVPMIFTFSCYHTILLNLSAYS